MGLVGNIVEHVKAAPTAVANAVKEEVGKAHNKDWTYLSSLIVVAHEGITEVLPEGKLKTLGALAMKVVYAVAYVIGVPTGVVGCVIGEVSRGVVGIKNAVVSGAKTVWTKVFPKKEEKVEEEGKTKHSKGPLGRAKDAVERRFSKGGTELFDAQ